MNTPTKGMKHVRLTCLHHPNLRWMCKEVAVNSIGQYNGARNIFFLGTTEQIANGEMERSSDECKCPPSDLRFAPEESYRP